MIWRRLLLVIMLIFGVAALTMSQIEGDVKARVAYGHAHQFVQQVVPYLSPAEDHRIFLDVEEQHWASSTVEWAVDQHIVQGYPDGTFRPGQPVSEPEFLAMLFRAYPDISLPAPNANGGWYEPYFSMAETLGWPVWHEIEQGQFNRGRVAQVIAASQGELLGINEAVQYLLDHQLANGKTAPTVEGFAIMGKLTRAEAVKLIENLKGLGVVLTEAIGDVAEPLDDQLASGDGEATAVGQTASYQVRGVHIGDSEASVIAALGEPARKDLSEYGFHWLIYNQDYTLYAQIGVQDGQVVALYTNSSDWSTKEEMTYGSSMSDVKEAYGQPLEFIQKGNTRYIFNESSHLEEPTYAIAGSYVTFFIDIHEGNTVTAVQIIEEQTELSLTSFYAQPSDELRIGFERQVLDLTNAVRVRYNKEALVWDDQAALLAGKHSEDMSDQDYFSHTNLQGLSPFDRMDEAGIAYRYASENIAAGQTSAIFAHEGWMNSQGHRNNILSDNATHLGVGIYMGGTMQVYYTQNFYTPKN